MDLSSKWIVKIKLWVDTKGWWDTKPIKIPCDTKEEAKKIADEYRTKIQNAISSLNSDTVTIENLCVVIRKLSAFKITIREPDDE